MKLVTTIYDWLSRRTGGVTPRKKKLKLFTTIYDDARLLGHFLAHYDRAGVTQFFIAVAEGHGSSVHARLSDHDLRRAGVADKYPFGVNAATEMRRRYQDPDEWAVMVDLDEFVEFPKPIFDIIADAQKEGANIVQAIMYDRFSADGKPSSFDASSDLSALFPVKARFIKVMGGADHKGVLVKGLIQPAPSVGNCSPKRR